MFNDIGLDMPTAIRLFLRQAVNHNGIPFPINRVDNLFNSNDDTEMIKASESSLAFWDNEIDDEVWNNI